MAFLTLPNILNPKPWRLVHYLQLLPSGTEGVQLSVAHLSDLWLKPRLCGTKQEVRSTGLFLWSTRSGYLPISRKRTTPLSYNGQTTKYHNWLKTYGMIIVEHQLDCSPKNVNAIIYPLSYHSKDDFCGTDNLKNVSDCFCLYDEPKSMSSKTMSTWTPWTLILWTAFFNISLLEMIRGWANDDHFHLKKMFIARLWLGVGMLLLRSINSLQFWGFFH